MAQSGEAPEVGAASMVGLKVELARAQERFRQQQMLQVRANSNNRMKTE